MHGSPGGLPHLHIELQCFVRASGEETLQRALGRGRKTLDVMLHDILGEFEHKIVLLKFAEQAIGPLRGAVLVGVRKLLAVMPVEHGVAVSEHAPAHFLRMVVRFRADFQSLCLSISCS